MRPIPDRLLRQYLAGALEPPEHDRVERALRDVAGLRDRLERLRAEALPMQAEEPDDGWRLPPPQRSSSLAPRAVPAPMMDAGPGGWWEVHVHVAADQQAHRVVVLERAGAAWRVAFPIAAEELVTAGQLPQEGGRARLAIAGDRPGRMAIVLVPPDFPIDFDIEPALRWAMIREAVLAGAVPAASFDTPADSQDL